MSHTILDESKMKLPAFSNEILRDHVLPSILGKETKQMMYFAGREVAKTFPSQSIEDICSFFTRSGWGLLTFEKEKKEEITFNLASPIISKRIASNNNAEFQLEAGYLAECIQSMKKQSADTEEKVNQRKGFVTFTVRWYNAEID